MIDELILIRDIAYKRGEKRITAILAKHPLRLPKQWLEVDPTLCKRKACAICSYRDCPYRDLLHYDKEGCPSCQGLMNGT